MQTEHDKRVQLAVITIIHGGFSGLVFTTAMWFMGKGIEVLKLVSRCSFIVILHG